MVPQGKRSVTRRTRPHSATALAADFPRHRHSMAARPRPDTARGDPGRVREDQDGQFSGVPAAVVTRCGVNGPNRNINRTQPSLIRLFTGQKVPVETLAGHRSQISRSARVALFVASHAKPKT